MNVAMNENAGPYSAVVTRITKGFKSVQAPGLKVQGVNSQVVRQNTDLETQELVNYIRSPEPSYVRPPKTSKVVLNSHDLIPLSNPTTSFSPVVSAFVPPADDLARKGRYVNVEVPDHYSEVPALLPDDAPLDLSCLGNKVSPEFDTAPLKTNYHFDKLYSNETIRMEWKLHQIVSCEREETKMFPAFAKESELREKTSQARWYHYPLYYFFGIDRTGLFQLKDEFDWYQNHPWSSFDQNGMDIYDLEMGDSEMYNTGNTEYSLEEEDLTLPLSETSVRSLDRYLA